MDAEKIKELLQVIKPENIIITDKVRFKVENIHKVNLDEALRNLNNPESLIEAENQPTRRPLDETYKLVFSLSERKKLVMVITYKPVETKIYIVTAFHSTKKMDKLIKRHRIVKSHGKI